MGSRMIGANVQTEKQLYSALGDMYLFIVGLQYRNSNYAAVGSSLVAELYILEAVLTTSRKNF